MIFIEELKAPSDRKYFLKTFLELRKLHPQGADFLGEPCLADLKDRRVFLSSTRLSAVSLSNRGEIKSMISLEHGGKELLEICLKNGGYWTVTNSGSRSVGLLGSNGFRKLYQGISWGKLGPNGKPFGLETEILTIWLLIDSDRELPVLPLDIHAMEDGPAKFFAVKNFCEGLRCF